MAVKMTEVAKGVLKITLPTPFSVGPINTYLIKGDILTLVDTGVKTEEGLQCLQNQLKKLGYRFRDIDQVLLTHHHVDHCGLLSHIQGETDCVSLSHPQAIPYITWDEAFLQWHDQFFLHFYRRHGLPEPYLAKISHFRKLMNTFTEKAWVDIPLIDEQPVPGHSDWKVIYTPGHSQSHLSLYRESDGVLIAGDHIIQHISTNAFIEPPIHPGEDRPLTLIQYRESLQRCLDLPLTKIISGHGPLIESKEVIRRRLTKHEERASHILMLLKDKEMTGFEISTLLFPSIFEKQLPLTMSETIGHLDYLEKEGRVAIEERDGVLYYRAE
ncbi:MBL fold metallo-hydrolase [Microaerobacter geothermalis]|uniref:MBL fold metallo-hydrolase n=1 Tax=Microaerobacter geothermalis TaxID=674972 RepID=UPI001F203B9F|nr:MBL fold metallo-hydrolase [Microaerobacter geothermalis]MCF6094925.1 MBL fold metallo-hydrolase [Microaerobacter geothermalis]